MACTPPDETMHDIYDIEAPGENEASLEHTKRRHDSDESSVTYIDESDTWEGCLATGDFRNRYELRNRPRENHHVFSTTWLDEDETADFDPNEELRRARALRKKSALVSRPRRVLACDSEHEPEVGIVAGKPKLVAILTFVNEASRTRFGEHVSNYLQRAGPIYNASWKGYSLRRKKVDSGSEGGRDEENQQKPQSSLIGHPAARGCWQCLELGDRCPLLDDELAWPCAPCKAEKEDCVLITEPKIKRACESCKRKRISCSYASFPEQKHSCEQCKVSGLICVAGPARHLQNVRCRHIHSAPEPVDSLEERAQPNLPRTCAKCKNGVCSCLEEDSDIAAMDVDSAIPEQAAHTSRPPLPSRNDAPAMDPAPKPGLLEARVSQIATKFCHPIQFNHQPSTNGLDPCHFCVQPGYPIFGLGARTVSVVARQGAPGFNEISGGHRSDGVQPTRICPACTLARLSVITCRKHHLRPIEGLSPRALNEDAAFAELWEDKGVLTRKWCSVCPSLARYECCAASHLSQDGCGLLLCVDCRDRLVNTYGHSLQLMLRNLEDQPTATRPLGLRADYELLKQDGLLMRYVLWSTQ